MCRRNLEDLKLLPDAGCVCVCRLESVGSHALCDAPRPSWPGQVQTSSAGDVSKEVAGQMSGGEILSFLFVTLFCLAGFVSLSLCLSLSLHELFLFHYMFSLYIVFPVQRNATILNVHHQCLGSSE